MRLHAERALRAAALLLLFLLLWRHWPGSTGREGTGDGGATARHLAVSDFSSDTTGDSTVAAILGVILAGRDGARAADTWPSLGLTVRTLPARASRGALSAARAAGVPISWTDSSVARGLAVSATSTADPDGRIVLAASGATGPLVFRDAGGELDSLVASAGGSRLLLRRGASWLQAGQRGSTARIAAPAPLTVKRLLVYARPGWEAKFTIAALEEAGWQVDASLPVSPRASVTVGAPLPPDTARYAAAIVLDSGIAPAAALMRYATQGGGVILASSALLDARLNVLSPARITGERGALPGGLLSPNPRSGLSASRVAALSDGITMERDAGGGPAVVVMRKGSGRVLASVYRESWQWRMEGGNGGADAHRAWWTGLVRAVAYVPQATVPLQSDEAGPSNTLQSDPAPYASFVARIGSPSGAPLAFAKREVPRRARDIDALLLVAIVVSLLAEWASRRLRGAR